MSKNYFTGKVLPDLWIRFDHKTVRRLDGFFESDAKGAVQKYKLLPQLYGINDPVYLHQRLNGPTPEIRIQNALTFYLEQLEKTFNSYKKLGFAAAYPIFSLGEQLKYHMVFACAHQKAARLASDIVSSEDDTYQRERQEYLDRQTHQLSLFPSNPTPTEVFNQEVSRLKTQIRNYFSGKALTRAELHYQLLCTNNKYWFGRIGGTHLTKALEELKSEGKITILGDSPLSKDGTQIAIQ